MIASAEPPGALFLVGAVAFATAASVLSATFNWPDVLREPADVVLPAYVAGGTSLVWTWLATAWTYAILAVPILLLPTVLGRRGDPALRVATAVGATSVLLSLIGFLRWVFVVPPLAHSYVTGDPVTQAAVNAAWTAQHQYGGALLGEHLGQLLVIAWSISLSVIILRSRMLPALAGRHRSRRQRALPEQPGRHPRHRSARLPGVGPRRPDRQHHLGTVGGRAGRRPCSRPRPTPRSPTTPHRRPRRRHPDTTGHDRPRELSAVTASAAVRTSPLRTWLLWTTGFLAFPLAGLAGTAVAGRVDSPFAALFGGAVAGLVIGAGQALVSRRRLDPRWWIPATALGMGLGLLLGACPRRLPHFARRARPDGRPHRGRPGCRASPCAAPRDPAPVGLGGRDAGAVGAGMDRHHPRRDRGGPAVHGLRSLRSGDILRAVRAAAAATAALPATPRPAPGGPPVQATA